MRTQLTLTGCCRSGDCQWLLPAGWHACLCAAVPAACCRPAAALCKRHLQLVNSFSTNQCTVAPAMSAPRARAQVNLRSALLGTKHAARAMKAAGRRGCIINTASIAGFHANLAPAGDPVYVPAGGWMGVWVSVLCLHVMWSASGCCACAPKAACLPLLTACMLLPTCRRRPATRLSRPPAATCPATHCLQPTSPPSTPW